MLTLLPKGVQKEIMKIFLIEDFFHLPLCQRHRWCTLSCKYLRKFSKKFQTALMVQSGAWGKLIHVENLKSKISWHCPFKRRMYRHLDLSEDGTSSSGHLKGGHKVHPDIRTTRGMCVPLSGIRTYHGDVSRHPNLSGRVYRNLDLSEVGVQRHMDLIRIFSGYGEPDNPGLFIPVIRIC
jgi:hypothetical protein